MKTRRIKTEKSFLGVFGWLTVKLLCEYVYFPYLCVYQLVDIIASGSFIHAPKPLPCCLSHPFYTQHLITGASGTVSQPTARQTSSLALPWSSHLTSWITPEVDPAALSSAFSFSHTSRPSGPSGGSGLLISPNGVSLYLLPLCTPLTFAFHAVTVTHPVQLHGCSLASSWFFGDLIEELDLLLNFSENAPLILLGDLTIQTEKSCDLLLLLWPLTQSLPPTHKATT